MRIVNKQTNLWKSVSCFLRLIGTIGSSVRLELIRVGSCPGSSTGRSGLVEEEREEHYRAIFFCQAGSAGSETTVETLR